MPLARCASSALLAFDDLAPGKYACMPPALVPLVGRECERLVSTSARAVVLRQKTSNQKMPSIYDQTSQNCAPGPEELLAELLGWRVARPWRKAPSTVAAMMERIMRME